jgi:hypothetical protein
MQANEFNQLPLSTKLQWVSFEGEFLMDIRYYAFKVNLYRVRDLLVEVFYDHKNDCITHVLLLDRQSSRMQFYADQVRLEIKTEVA